VPRTAFKRKRRLAGLVLVLAAFGFGTTACSDDEGVAERPPSVAEARKATVENPNDPQAWRDLGAALRTTGATTKAIAALNRYAKLQPKDSDGLRELGALYLAQAVERQQSPERAPSAKASFEQAAATYRRIVALEPKLPSVRLELGQAAEQAGDTAAAIAAYRAFLRLVPNDPNAPLVRRHVTQLVKQLAAGGSG
jgi:regulator of sirC expression with transglutaminase-like and TPR domain